MYSVFVTCDPAEEDLLIAQAWEAGTTGIVEEPGGFRAFFEDENPAAFPGELRREPEVDWVQATRDSFPALVIGERFYLVPPWDESSCEGRFRLVINPGMACGTGWHPCTQLCLEALEKYVQPGSRVLDVGSGSGILSKAARLLGAGAVIGCDIDPEVSPQFVVSADAVKTGSADLLIANISAAVVTDLLPDFVRVARTLILSGFTEAEIPERLTIRERLQRHEWVCLIALSGEQQSD